MFEWLKKEPLPEVGKCYQLKDGQIQCEIKVTSIKEDRVMYSIGTYNGLQNSCKAFNRLYEAI